MSKLSVIVSAVNDDDVLRRNLGCSPDVVSGRLRLVTQRGHKTAGEAYNAGLTHAPEQIVAFIHQDVYLPSGWADRIDAAIAELDAGGRPWSVLGVWGVRSDRSYVGRVYCNASKRAHVGQTGQTLPVCSVDEIVIVVNTRWGLKFDEGLPGYHLYATDLIQQASRVGALAYATEAPVVHNSRPNLQWPDPGYRAAYRYMQRKWSGHLPLVTCVRDVTRTGWPLYREILKAAVRDWRGIVNRRLRASDPGAIADGLGYTKDVPAV